ncbi:MAG: hypothetical protein IJZ29_04210 [Clostridia bacterium]|nr:hypothetical protein [Clostridia bacterium]
MDNLKLAYDKAFELEDYITCIKMASKNQNFKIDLNALSNAVIKSENPYFALNYVRILKPKDKSDFEKIIIDSKNAHIASMYAVENKDDCNIQKLEEIVLNYGDAFDSADFVYNIDEANIEAHKELILKEEEGYACFLYCKKVQPVGRQLKEFERIVLESEDADLAYLFARDIYGANLAKLGEIVIEFGSNEDVIMFATLISTKMNKELGDVRDSFKECGLLGAILSSPLTNLVSIQSKLEDHIKIYGTYEDVANYLLSVDGADVFELQSIIEETNRMDLKLDIAFDPDVDLESLTTSICKNQRKPQYKVVLNDLDIEM